MLAALLLVLGGCAGGTKDTKQNEAPAASQSDAKEESSTEEVSVEELYDQAVRDAAFADEDEIKPLISLTQDDPMTTWDDNGRVLLVTWHNYPESYPEGEEVTLDWGTVWTFTDKEIAEKYTSEVAEAEDKELRLQQLIGFAPDSEHSTFTGFWVNPEDVVRPAYQPDPTDGSMTVAFGEDVDPEFKTWFDENILSSYFYGAYPWSRLGYTYDWSQGSGEYGLTEFLVNQGAQVQVAFTDSTDEFLQRLDQAQQEGTSVLGEAQE